MVLDTDAVGDGTDLEAPETDRLDGENDDDEESVDVAGMETKPTASVQACMGSVDDDGAGGSGKWVKLADADADEDADEDGEDEYTDGDDGAANETIFDR